MVEIGNFQFRNSADQNNSKIKYDTHTDINSLNYRRSGSIKILESFNFPPRGKPWDSSYFNWSESYIRSRFSLAEQHSSKVDYLVFLLHEEIYLLSMTSGWQKVPISTANGNAYIIEGIPIPKMPEAGESAFLVALLKAWKSLCNRLNKKAAILGCAAPYEPNVAIGWKNLYSQNGLNYIAKNYDMIYIYRFPVTKSQAECSTKGYCSKEFIEYWRNTLGFTGKINYILDTYFSNTVGSLDYNVIKADFVTAANSGADIVSAYPFKNVKDNDSFATSRLIQIFNEYQPSSCQQISCNLSIN